MGLTNQRQENRLSRRFSREQMERYFFPEKIPAYTRYMLIAGALLFILCVFLLFKVGGNALLWSFVVLSGVLILTGGLRIFFIRRANPTDEQYDEWVYQQANAMISTALKLHGLKRKDLSGPIQYIQSFVLPGSSVAEHYRTGDIQVKQGKDGVWRYSVHVFTYFFPMKSSVALLTIDLNVFNSSFVWQNEEYPYQHIINVTTSLSSDSVLFQNERFRYRVEEICLKISNSETLVLGAFQNATLVDNKQYAPDFTMAGTNIQKTLRDLRALLRPNLRSR